VTRAARRARRLDRTDSERQLFRHVDLTSDSAARVLVSLKRFVGRARARQRAGWSGAPQVLVSTAHDYKSDGEEEVSGHAPFCYCWWLVSLVSRVPLSRGWFLSTARDSAGAGRNKHTPLASGVISFSHECRFGLFSPVVTSFFRVGRN